MTQQSANHQQVILVDQADNPIGSSDKLEAHQKGQLHRAISVVLLDIHTETEPLVLLQQRQHDKYHCGGLWSNACCSHPRPGEDSTTCAERRLFEELQLHCPLSYCGHFIYRAELDNGLIEHELDHVFIGHYDANTSISPNADEVAATRWLTLPKLQSLLQQEPQRFTPWLQQVLQKAIPTYRI